MATLHFSLGEGIADTMRQIAREHLFCDYNIEKALSVYTDGIGATEEQAKQFILGTQKLQLADDGVHLEYCEPTKEDEFDLEEWLDGRLEKFETEERYIRAGLEDITRKGLSHDCKELTIELPKDFLRTLKPEDLSEKIRWAVLDNNGVMAVHDLFVSTDRFLTESAKLYRVMKYLDLCTSWGGTQQVIHIKRLYDTVLLQDESQFERTNPALTGMISRYVDAVREIDAIKTIQPSLISEGFDASWISPEGDYYGLNGEIANMLHIELADKLKDIIPHGELEKCETFDTWLEMHGWVKIHNDWVLFYNQDGKKSPTEAQVKAITQYGQIHYGGLLRFGYQLKPVSAALFEMMADLKRRELFDI